ncbi:RNA-directed DNA polymerase-like protein [Gossypium australe]|uniref:RNA-directed DNA polymerase-like protein n=1 Tax=Gossypium australe TaxID=47621 RepID=A0A5B6WHG2_9ROSI|nr:RNA-directed DNA polymerase-like protein [Gossypium australe]
MEKLIQEMLQANIIKDNCNPFFNCHGEEKNDSWRLYVDYRQLNQHTIKGKLPIHVIEKLLDELGHAFYFSKLDLQFGYHQIKIWNKDIHKTTFRTHEGHYEFLVLTNAPNFQELMNVDVKPLLRKEVLTLSREYQSYAKKTKRSSDTTKIEYLGHIISKRSVAMDATKIEGVLTSQKVAFLFDYEEILD